jgi:methylthioribose-1-phosphate isomerase
MDPLNKKERSTAFIKFLLLFIAGIVIILIPFYFLVGLPQEENSLVNEDLNVMQKELVFQRDVFAVQVDSVKSLISKFDMPGQDIDKLKGAIGLKLSEMEKSFAGDTTWRGKMYGNVVKCLSDLKESRSTIMDLNLKLKKCQESLDETGKELEKAKDKNKDSTGG